MTLEDYKSALRGGLVDLKHLGPGVGVSRRLIAKLRFERLLAGSTRALEAFEEDPAQFSRVFARYLAEVPSRHWFPQEEARAYEAWLDVPRGTGAW